MQTNQGIHCKVAAQDQIRRFLLTATEYNALTEQISQLFGLPKDSVVIKYLDDENDKVTISSDEELKFAIDISKDTLRLTVEMKTEACQVPIKNAVSESEPALQLRGVDNKGEYESAQKFAGKREFYAEKWRRKQEKLQVKLRENPEAINHHVARFSAKRAHIEAKLKRIESFPPGHPALNCVPKLHRKLEWISARIERLQELTTTSEISNLPTGLVVDNSTPIVAPVSQSELSKQIQVLKEQIPGMRLSLRQAHLQLQLCRTNLQAVRGENDKTNFDQLKNALEEAKKNESAQKDLLHKTTKRLENLQEQAKLEKERAKAENDAKKAVARQAHLAAKLEHRRGKEKMY